MKSALALLREGERFLAPSLDARHDALTLLCRVLSLETSAFALLDARADEESEREFYRCLRLRRDGQPLQYILHEAWFMGLPFCVDERVLIPRQDTELLCELALKKNAQTALELCTGSGAVAIALARLGGARVTATDISADALCVARKNAQSNGAAVEFLQGDLFAALDGTRRFDLILCNPPYLTRRDMLGLQAEVRREPALALFGGEDGLSFYRRLREGFLSYLNDHGSLLMEIGFGQAEEVCGIFSPYETVCHADLNGIPRVVEIGL